MPPSEKASKPVRSVAAGDTAIMRKPHPCGSAEWIVTRTGADIGLRCQGCGRKVMLTREAFERGARRLIGSATDAKSEKDEENA